MYIGHYRVSLAAKRVDNRIPPLATLLGGRLPGRALVDLHLVGLERSTINPAGAASKINFDYLAITHGLLTSLGWSVLIL